MAVNVLEAHAAHSRSDVNVAAAVSYEPTTHGAVSDVHVSPVVVAENELPQRDIVKVQPVHRREQVYGEVD